MFDLIKTGTNIDFVGKRKFWLALSVLMIAGSFVLFFTKGLNYGIDFTGGAMVQIQVPQGWDTGKVRQVMETEKIEGLRVQQLGDANSHEFMVRAQGDENSLNLISQKVEKALASQLSAREFQIQKVDVVGPAAGSSLRTSGFLSMFYALICILIYVGIRFDFRYAPGAILALFHDTMITIGVFIVMGKVFDLQVLGALLALIGYSNNDTIVIFDRVRETVKLHPELKFEESVNRAVNETLGRTILTSTTTFLTAGSLWLFGGSTLEDFAFTFLIGIVVGAYSSIFIASSFVISLTKWNEKRGAKTPVKRKYQPRPEPKLQ